MSETGDIKTISSRVERNHTRRSLPQRDGPIKPILRYTRSQSHGQNHVPIVPATIPELEVINEKTSRSSSIQSQNNTRKHSRRSEKSVQGYENQAYDGPLPDRQQFDERGTSARSSSARSSVQSLQVQKEQYCCFSRWSPCERKLVASVAVLATIIIILLFIVSFMAGGDDKKLVPDRYLWKL